jgi:hypothetical protein
MNTMMTTVISDTVYWLVSFPAKTKTSVILNWSRLNNLLACSNQTKKRVLRCFFLNSCLFAAHKVTADDEFEDSLKRIQQKKGANMRYYFYVGAD